MANINDYLLWRGDLSVEKDGFNELDSMILSRFSYLPFNRIALKDVETVESIAKKLDKFKDDEFNYHGDKDMITRMAKSIRFKDMKVTDYVENTDAETEKQFSAITIHISDKEFYISFCGTDNTIIGWKEDFNMSFMENIPAQIEGVEYARQIANKYRGKIRIGGHSKGGNVAVYAAIASNKKIQDRLIKVSNYDGPGFDKKIVKDEKYKRIIEKVYTYIPQSSIIGRVLEHEEKYEIVQSIEKGIYQHDIFSWQVIGTDLIHVKNVTNSSEFINKTLRAYLKETKPEQRKIFIDIVFELLETTNANTFREFSTAKAKNIGTMIKNYKNVSEEDKKLMMQMVGEFVDILRESVKQEVNMKLPKKTISGGKDVNSK